MDKGCRTETVPTPQHTMLNQIDPLITVNSEPYLNFDCSSTSQFANYLEPWTNKDLFAEVNKDVL